MALHFQTTVPVGLVLLTELPQHPIMDQAHLITAARLMCQYRVTPHRHQPTLLRPIRTIRLNLQAVIQRTNPRTAAAIRLDRRNLDQVILIIVKSQVMERNSDLLTTAKIPPAPTKVPIPVRKTTPSTLGNSIHLLRNHHTALNHRTILLQTRPFMALFRHLPTRQFSPNTFLIIRRLMRPNRLIQTTILTRRNIILLTARHRLLPRTINRRICPI